MDDFGIPPRARWRAYPVVPRYLVSENGEVFDTEAQEKLRPRARGGKYRGVDIYIDGERKTMYLHRLVLETFTGACPPGMEGCHNDGNPANNRLTNLRWDTKEANVADIIEAGHHVSGGKLDDLDRATICVLYNRLKWSQTKIAQEFDVEQSTISSVLRKAKDDEKFQAAWPAGDGEDDSAVDLGEEPG
jgi:hypothetical protein